MAELEDVVEAIQDQTGDINDKIDDLSDAIPGYLLAQTVALNDLQRELILELIKLRHAVIWKGAIANYLLNDRANNFNNTTDNLAVNDVMTLGHELG